MNGLRRFRRKDLLLLLLKGPLLAGDLLVLECDDLEESRERRLLLALVLRRIPRRLRFFNSGGRGGFPGEIPSGKGEGDGEVHKDVENGRGVVGVELCLAESSRLVLPGVCGVQHLPEVSSSPESRGDFSCVGDLGVAGATLVSGLITGCIQEPIDSRDDSESWNCSSFMLPCSDGGCNRLDALRSFSKKSW